MKKLLTILALFTFMSTSVFATELEEAQDEIIRLQEEKIELLKQLNKRYETNGICYRRESHCIRKQEQLNSSFGTLSGGEVTLKASCQRFSPRIGTICEGSTYLLKVYVKITPNLEDENSNE